MGKYSHVIDKLPRYMGEEPKYQEKVEATKAQILESPFTEGLSESALEAAVKTVATKLEETLPDILKDFLRATGSKKYASQYGLIFKNLRTVKEELEARLSDVNLVMEAYGQLLDNQLEIEGASAVTLDNGYNVRVQKEPHMKVTDKEVFRKWCIDHGYENEMALHWSTANMICKDLLLEGEAQPDGTELTAKPKIVVTKPRA
jgi:hypothetical protein